MNQTDVSMDARAVQRQQASGRWKLFAIIAICTTPMLASYLTYYVIKPQAKTNYGTFLRSDVHSVPAALHTASLDGKALPLTTFEGKWLLLQVDSGSCADACRKKLYDMRQLRLTQGRERDRVERIWLITDAAPLDTVLMREYDGTQMLRAQGDAVNKWLPAETGASATDYLYLVDPLGRLMMRFPKDRDPNLIKKDLGKLLRASSIG